MNGRTNLVGILGWPVAHSMSPAMHNAAFLHLNLNWAYVPLAVSSSNVLESAIKGIVSCGFRGANLTVPYKEKALQFTSSISDDARVIGAINTLTLKKDEIHGENTDAPGFLKHLDEENIDVSGKNVAVVGAGGAARAIVFALAKAKAQKIYLINRSPERARTIANFDKVSILDWNRSSFYTVAKNSFLIINTTTLGLKESDPLPWDIDVPFSKQQIIYDAIYKTTPLLKKAQEDGARAICGRGMLLWQGAIAFELWTGIKAPVEIMRKELNYV